jgi:glutamyl-tRNA synthetase
MNLAVAVDDHLLDLTHVLRGKDHLNNTYRQEYVYDYLGWKKPEYIHYGRVSIEEAELSTSKMAKGIKDGLYSGWDDPQLGTLSAIRRRGIRPEAIRRYWTEVGIKEVDIEFSWKTLFTYNRELIDDDANRYFFVAEPVEFTLKGCSGDIVARAPLHPDHPERGCRELSVRDGSKVYLGRSDLDGDPNRLRLKDLCNVSVEGRTLVHSGNDLSILKQGVKIVHWVPEGSLPAEVLLTDGKVLHGLAEPALSSANGKVVQLERFAFVRVERTEPSIRCVLTHR